MAHPTQQVNPEVLDQKARAWIAAQHSSVPSVDALRLKHGLQEPYFSSIAQIAAKVKYAKKFDGLPIHWIFPVGHALEQSSSVITARYKAKLMDSPHFIDACAGMGVDTWAFEQRDETISGLCFEINTGIARLLERNLHSTQVVCAEMDLAPIDAWISDQKIKREDLCIYLDPDRRAEGKRTFGIREGTPDLIALQSSLFERAQKIIAKHSPMLDLSSTRDLVDLERVLIVQVHGECKEILTVQSSGFTGVVELSVVELDTEEHLTLEPSYASVPVSSSWKEFIIQPAAGLSKSQLHASLADRNGWSATAFGNLYTADHAPQPSSHYRVYRLVEEAAPYKLKSPFTHAAIECIGFPETVDAVRKKLKVKESAEQKVFALRSGRKKMMILCERVS